MTREGLLRDHTIRVYWVSVPKVKESKEIVGGKQNSQKSNQRPEAGKSRLSGPKNEASRTILYSVEIALYSVRTSWDPKCSGYRGSRQNGE